MRMFISILCIVLSLFIIKCSTWITVDVYAKSAKFIDNESLITNFDLKITTSRAKRTGIVVWSGYINNPINYLLMDIKLFYRYGTIYRIYLFDKKRVESCELFKDPKDRKPKYNNPLANLLMKAVIPFTRKYATRCPFPAGWYNGTLDVNDTVSSVLPPIVPAGTYKVWVRFYYEDNNTLVEMEGTGVVKPNHKNRDMDLSMLNMG